MPITFNNIILWRHAEAVDSNHSDSVDHDMARALTKKGQRQAKKMAKWLNKNLNSTNLAHEKSLSNTLSTKFNVYSSDALRAYQTAQALQANIEVRQGFNPNSSLQKVLAELNLINQVQNLILVGHSPWIGQLAAYLLGAKADEFSIKKGAIWWLRLSESEPEHYEILTVQTPDLLR